MTLWTKGMGAIIKAIPRSKKVSPDIKSVKPTKLSVKESLKKTKSDEYYKRIKQATIRNRFTYYGTLYSSE